MPSAGLAEALRAASLAPVPSLDPCEGRGIVICAGGARLFTCAWLLLAILRRNLGCRLPVEVWHIGPAELGPPMRSLLEMFDVEVVDALQVAQRHPVATLGGWQLKTYALLHSRFEQVLLLDADNLPIADPAPLFDCADFRESGAVFWPDIVRLRPGNPVWTLAGLPADSGPSFETGQVLIDKQRHRRALHLTDWINQRHVAFEDMLYGDKDAFYVGWRVAGSAYALVVHPPRLLEGTFCQHAPDGRVLFQHRNRHKWLLNGANPRIEGFRLEDECFAVLSELRTLWDGEVFDPPPRSAAARATELRLAESGRFWLVWLSSHEKAVRLDASHRVEGGGNDVRYWFVADGAMGPELQFVSQGRRRGALRCEPDGVWRGTAGALQVELRPEAAGGPASRGETPVQQAALVVAADLLDRALRPSDAGWADQLATLATLAALAPGAPPLLEAAAARPPTEGRRARLARAALERHAAAAPSAPRPRAGTGWLAESGNLDAQSERVPKR